MRSKMCLENSHSNAEYLHFDGNQFEFILWNVSSTIACLFNGFFFLLLCLLCIYAREKIGNWLSSVYIDMPWINEIICSWCSVLCNILFVFNHTRKMVYILFESKPAIFVWIVPILCVDAYDFNNVMKDVSMLTGHSKVFFFSVSCRQQCEKKHIHQHT